MTKVLFLGDIVGRPARRYVLERVTDLREEMGADFVVANAENAAGGAGLTKKLAEELVAAGIDALTLGDHVWDQKNFDNEITELERVCRPANLPVQNPGRAHLILERSGVRLAVFTVLGRNFIPMKASCPFETAEQKLGELRKEADCVLVEAHMEATSEKQALGWFLEGRCAGVIGTHTHVPTADGRILPGGTAYITDVGMSGSYASVLGREVEPVVATFLDGMKRRFPVAETDLRLCGCLLGLDPATGRAHTFDRVEISQK